MSELETQLYEALKGIEFAECGSFCPECGGRKVDYSDEGLEVGHRDWCALAKAMRAYEGAE